MVRYRKLGYVALNVSDVARSTGFYREHLGLADAGDGPGASRLFRCSSDHHNLMLCPGRAPGLKRLAFEMEAAADLERLRELLERQGLATREVPEEERAALHLGAAFRLSEPATGLTLEFYDCMRESAVRFAPTVAKIQRLGHVVVNTDRYAEAVRFFTQSLNFRVSDAVEGRITFMRCFPNPFHHSLALLSSPRRVLNHVNFMVSEIDDIGRALWRFQKAGIPVVHGPGRHPPSESVFLYFLDPDGITLEYSFGMEEFPERAPRKPRLLESSPASIDYWGAPVDPRKSAVGEIE